MATMQVPRPDAVMGSSEEFAEWLMKVVAAAIDQGHLSFIGKMPIEELRSFEIEDPFDPEAEVFAVAFGDADDLDAGELPIHVGPILYYDDQAG
jgi:hypothetical protein